MPDDAQRALKIEEEFLSGVEANLESAKGSYLRGSEWQTARYDEELRLKELLARQHRYDRELLKQLPKNRRFALLGYQRRFWLFKRPTGVAMASVINPLAHFAEGKPETAPPIGVPELLDHVRGLVGDSSLPHVVGVCSPSGFTDEVRNAQLDLPNVTLVLAEPREGGGWRVTGKREGLSEQVLALFDPEDASQKINRVRAAVQDRSADLLVGGVDGTSLSARLGVPEPLVAQALEQIARDDPELRVTKSAGNLMLYRGAATTRPEKSSMNVVDRIRSLFAREGDESQKINVLAERRAALTQRRDRIYEDIGKLEEREGQLLTQGKSATSSVVKRRLASQLAQLRKDIARQNTTANMLNQQVNILSTNIHNLTLIQQGQMAQLPDTEELTQNAVKAEEMIESLQADADMVGGLETGIGEALSSDEELAILQEFEEPAAEAATAPPPAAEPTSRVKPESASETPAPPDPPQRQKPRPAEPEGS